MIDMMLIGIIIIFCILIGLFLDIAGAYIGVKFLKKDNVLISKFGYYIMLFGENLTKFSFFFLKLYPLIIGYEITKLILG